MSNLGRKLLDKPYALWAVLFVLAPLCMVVYLSLIHISEPTRRS